MLISADNIGIASLTELSYIPRMKKTERITIRVTDNTKKDLESFAAKDDRSLNYYINKVLEQYIIDKKVSDKKSK